MIVAIFWWLMGGLEASECVLMFVLMCRDFICPCVVVLDGCEVFPYGCVD